MTANIKRIDMIENAYHDKRGWVTNPLEVSGVSSKTLSNLHIASVQPGCIRGNHYHIHATEWLLIFGGAANFYWRSSEVGTIHEEEIKGSAPVLFEIPPGIEHAVLNRSEKEIFLMAFRNIADADTIQSHIVKK
jgi:dTDP-4-dehydrorhamnose 3,5-epimerase-like enzyme